MHKYNFRSFYFINKFEPNHINKLDKKVSIIYRNYSINLNKELIIKIRDFCKKSNRKFYLSNNLKLAIRLDLDGVYLPSFNKELNVFQFNLKKKFELIGSAHNIKEIRIKEKQCVKTIFLSSIFKRNKNYLGMNKFNNLLKVTSGNVIALGGISKSNINKLKQLKIIGFAGISYFR
tara:strand:+ start:2678 stop:3205 length:528 start_codon:yes stop_codon:yes gene_type:complete